MNNSIADIHIKVNADVKAEAEEILKKIGISVSDLMNMTLRRVVYERRIPFDTQIPDAEVPESISVGSMDEVEEIIRNRMKHDDGTRYTIDEVWEHLDKHRREMEEHKVAYA